MFSTQLRRDHIQGMLLGAAIGESLGSSLYGLSRRAILKKNGRKPLRYRLLPGVGLPGRNTSLMLLATQSIACSASESKYFGETYAGRLGWCIFSFPVGLDSPSVVAGLKSWLSLFDVPTGSQSTGNSPTTRAIFVAMALHGTGSRLKKWIETSTAVTHLDPLVTDGCQVLAGVADAVAKQLEQLNPLETCRKVVGLSSQPELRQRMDQLPDFLQNGRSPRFVANYFGWDTRIDSYIVPTAVMATYCFLRYPLNFRKAVESAIRLGGDTNTLGAIVGGLSGGILGSAHLPQDLVHGLSDFAYGPTWIKGMSIRMSHWPHGPDDLHAAHAEPTAAIELTTMNLMRGALTALNRVCRIPLRLRVNNVPRRLRRK